MTNEEIQNHNNQNLKVFCRGHQKIEGERLSAINIRRMELSLEGDVPRLRDMVDRLNSLLGINVLAEDTVQDLDVAILQLMDTRIPCGQDVSDLVGAPPYDGELRIVQCPSCGLEMSMYPPTSEEEQEKKEQRLLRAVDDILSSEGAAPVEE